MIPYETEDQLAKVTAEVRRCVLAGDPEGAADAIDDHLRDIESEYTVGLLHALRAYVPLACADPDAWLDEDAGAVRIEAEVAALVEEVGRHPLGGIVLAEYTMFEEYLDLHAVAGACALVASIMKEGA